MRKSQYFFYKHKVTTSLLLSSSKRNSFTSPLLSNRVELHKKLTSNFYKHSVPIRFKQRSLGNNILFFMVTGISSLQLNLIRNYKLNLLANILTNLPKPILLKYSSLLSLKHNIAFSKKQSTIFYNLSLGVNFSERGFRILFNLPVNGQKTWSPSKTTNRYNNFILNQKFFFFKKCLPKSTLSMFYSEYFNLMYQAFFLRTWKLSKRNTRKGFFGKKFININNSFYLNALNLPSLKKSSKNKNLGFRFGFTRKLRTHLL